MQILNSYGENFHKDYHKESCWNQIEYDLTTLDSAANFFFSTQSHKMNEVMKTLTVVSTIFIPLTFLAGIYGMNFTNIPELTWKWGYFGFWLIILVIFILMLFYFKRKKWF